jgi:hypothetical protein
VHDPDRAANHVHADHVQGVVVVKYVFLVDGAVADQPRRCAYNDCRPRLHVTGRRGDRGQAGDSAGSDAHARWLPAAPPLDAHPDEHRCAGS